MKWYEELFAAEDPARFERYIESPQSRCEANFIIRELGLQPGARVLDLCCGQGRHLVEMARRGLDMVGLDLSSYMLEECRKAAGAAGVSPHLVISDMRSLCFGAEFDAVINVFTSFGYLESDDEDKRVLHAVSSVLKPDGCFLIDMLNRDYAIRRYREQEWQENSRGDLTIAQRSFDPITGRTSDRELTIYADGRKIERRFSIRFYTYQELALMLQNAGLEPCSVHGDFDSSAFTIDSPRMIVIAQKMM